MAPSPVSDRTTTATASWTVADDLPWQRALHLDAPERRAAGNPSPHPRAHRRWTRVFGADGVGPAADALGFGSDGLRDLVEGPDAPAARSVPDWVRRADHHLALGRAPSAHPEEHLLRPGDLGLPRVAADLVRGYQRALYSGAARAADASPRLRDLPRLLVGTFPLSELHALTGRTLVLEMNVARIRGQLVGRTPQERYRDYLRRLDGDVLQREFWSEYTVLLRQVDRLLSGWLDSRLEFARRLASDLRDLDSLHGERLGSLDSVRFGAGDTHRGGRSVAVAGFSGVRLVYKPHPLGSDAAWGAVIDWFNSQTPAYDLRTPRHLPRARHGWTAFVEHLPCRADEGDAFYWRLGALLALNYALCGTDLHHENLIASGAHPVMIDMEALFHGAAPREPDGARVDPAERLIGESVVRVGLLPSKMMVRDGGAVRAFDASGVGADGEHESLVPLSVARGAGTDEMVFGSEYVTVRGGSSHRPHCDGTLFDPREHVDAFTRGFTAAYWYVAGDREAWLAEGGLLDGFRGAELRHIARPTAFYAAVLSDSSHPDFLRDGRDHDRVLASVACGADGTRHWEPLAAAELAELRVGDIPHFTCRSGSTDVVSGRGTVVPGFLAEPPEEAVRRRVLHLGQEDLDTQTALVRRAFDSLQPARTAAPGGVLPTAGEPLSRDTAVEGALRIAHGLCDEAVQDGDDLGWIGLEFVEERFWRLGGARTDLYSGLAGIGLFLSRTAQVTGDGRIRDFAERTARILADRAGELRREHDRRAAEGTLERELGRRCDPGGFGPVGGLLYHLAHAGSVHARGDWLDAAELCLPVLRAHVDHDVMHDLLSGAAGACLAALALHRVRPGSGALAVARHAASALLDRAAPQETGIGWPGAASRVPLSGASHGNAGVVHALLRLNAVAPRPEYLSAAARALAHERALLDPALGNWRDLRPDSGDAPGVTWCHGAPGIGLARAAGLGLGGAEPLYPVMREDVETAERTTRSVHFPEGGGFRSLGDNGLCHGDLGNLEFLLAAARLRGDDEGADAVLRSAAALAEHGLRSGWSTGPLTAEAVPGLMYGRAGIGYNLLRLALPARVPSVLSLDAP
ncbi:type 2 lanthipeptide synthetase LanM family protein [Nocardiopsis dassonvillei]|uniref:type 2 lanthipeptide synthetase LanM family protein n=1 Tax=Nocardiopsis dassonvillei TaxID=2014 RepID=UPI0033C3282D